MFSRLSGGHVSRPVVLFFMLSMGLLSGCQQAVPTAVVVDRTEPAIEVADAGVADVATEGLSPLASIELLLEAANNRPASEGFELRRQAMDLSIDYEAAATTRRRIAVLERQYPDNAYRVRIEIVRQKLLLAQGRSRDILANIDSIDLLATAEEKVRLVELKADALERAGFAVESVRLRIALDGLYADSEQTRKQENDRLLWLGLMRLASATISGYISETADTLSGWLELAYLSRQHRYDSALLYQAINDWSLRYAIHPAHRYIIGYIRQRQIAISHHPRHIALLLPLSGKLQAAGQAIRDGFVASYLEIKRRFGMGTVIDVYDTESNPELARLSLQQASDSGADFIVGPLDKAAVAAAVAADEAVPAPPPVTPKPLSGSLQDAANSGAAPDPVPLLVLNTVPRRLSELNSNHKIYQFTLAPESEAMQVANRAHLDDRRQAMIIVPENAWGNRLYEAFASTYRKPGGVITAQYRYQRGTSDHSRGIQLGLNLDKSKLRYQRVKQLLNQNIKFTPSLRRDIDVIFLAASPQEARQIKSQLKFFYADHIPVYATSHIFTTKLDAARDKDLDGIYFTDMPWTLNDKPAPGSLRKILRDNWPADVTNQFSRFHALGVDAFRLVPQLKWLAEHPDEWFNGATGRLSVSSNGVVERESSWAVFRNGIPSTQSTMENQYGKSNW